MDEYLKCHKERPFVLRQYLNSSDSPCPPWPAIHRWKSAEYLLGLIGEGRVVPVEVGRAYDEVDWGQRIIPFRDFLARAGYDIEREDDDKSSTDSPLYLAQHPLLRQFPALERDISIPDFVWTCPSAPASMPAYRPPITEDGVETNVWVGSGKQDIVSPAHTVNTIPSVIAS